MHAACSWERGARATGACAAAVVAAPLRRKPRRPASWFIRCLRSPTTSTLTSPMQLPQSFEVTWPHLPSPRYTPNLTRILDGGPRTSFPSPPGTSGVPGSAPLPWRPYTTWLAHFGRLVGRGALVSAFAEFTVLERGDPQAVSRGRAWVVRVDRGRRPRVVARAAATAELRTRLSGSSGLESRGGGGGVAGPRSAWPRLEV